MFELKPLSREAIPPALAKAERYRLLNEAIEAESICLDILAVEPDHQEAIVTLLLALTDQFHNGAPELLGRARALLPRLGDEYRRAYYAAIICERRAKALLTQAAPGAGATAFEWFKDAMAEYERAEAIRPPGNDDAVLRWNTCARILDRHAHVRGHEERYEPQFLE